MAERYLRFSISDRIEHVVQVIAFTMLAITGIVQRYAGVWISQRIVDLFGGIESVRVIHRVFATILMVAVVYHVAAIGYRKFVQRKPSDMMPRPADWKAAQQSFKYVGGRAVAPPKQGRFTWEEKIEYLALVWGTLIMVVTGFLLWNPIATARLLPGEFIPLAKVAHSWEALLAILAVIVWHMYHVHLKRFNKSMFTGYMTREEMAHEHPLELEAIESGRAFVPPQGPEVRRRARIYFPIATGVSLVLAVGIFQFITFEDTAIATIAPVEPIGVFAPVETTAAPATSPTTTTTEASPPEVVYWEDSVRIIMRRQRCTDCHGRAMALGGIDLTSYDGAAAAIVPGDPEASPLVILMEAGAHPTLLDEEQLALVRTWITAGAPESPGDGSAALTWDGSISAVLGTCAGCHSGGAAMGGFDVTDYESVLASVVPGDPDGSPLYALQVAGGHAGQLDDDALSLVRDWIAAGAP